jgi:hypothetical protein
VFLFVCEINLQPRCIKNRRVESKQEKLPLKISFMKKRKIMATGSIAVALFLSSYSSSSAARYSFSKPRIFAQEQSVLVSDTEQEYLGVPAGDFREDLGIDPTFGDSLVQQGFSPSQIQKIFTSASLKVDYGKMPLSE